MSDPDHPVTTALRDLADQAGPPRIRIDDAWRAGRRRRRAAIITPAVAIAAALTAGLLTGLPGRGSSYSPAAYALERAARAAAQPGQPVPHPGQYILATSAGTSMTDTDSGSWLTVERRRIWWPVDARKPGVERYDAVRNEPFPWSGPAPARGLGASWLPVPPQGCPGAPPARFTYQFLAALPTSPARLRAWIYGHSNGGQNAGSQAWTDITDLLETTLTPPRLTAALLRVAATIPGATVVRHATDAAGRAGIAVTRRVQGSTEDSELVFSARTYRLLGGRTALTVPEKGVGPPGTVVGGWALLNKIVVSHLPRHPQGLGGAASHCR
ncbi:MAG: CU044_5270 family protein [Actinobacteria bacterium]|nr:CU044_5270 family protein [Actinomycetota bacterium]